MESPLQSATTPPRDRNSTPSISPLSTTSKTQLELHATARPSQPLPQIQDHDGDSSSLSEFDAEFDDQKDADSEAETERLEASPQKPWKTADVARTPSKLNQATALSDRASSPEPLPQSPSPTQRVIGMSPCFLSPTDTDHSLSSLSLLSRRQKAQTYKSTK